MHVFECFAWLSFRIINEPLRFDCMRKGKEEKEYASHQKEKESKYNKKDR